MHATFHPEIQQYRVHLSCDERFSLPDSHVPVIDWTPREIRAVQDLLTTLAYAQHRPTQEPATVQSVCAWCGAETDTQHPFPYPVIHGSVTAYCCSERHQYALAAALA